MQKQTTTANAVWIATALLHKENPHRAWFSSKEIEARVLKEGLLRTSLQTLRAHISQHCVANKPASPDTHRKLYDVGRGRRRLYFVVDKAHPSRANGRTEPSESEIPAHFRYLLRWFRNQARRRPQPQIENQPSRFAAVLAKIRRLTPEERKQRAIEMIQAVVALERGRQKASV